MSARDTPRPSCGHPASAIHSADEGTSYCTMCEEEARAAPPVRENNRAWWLVEVQDHQHPDLWRVPLHHPVVSETLAREEAAAWEEDGYRTRVTLLTPTPTVPETLKELNSLSEDLDGFRGERGAMRKHVPLGTVVEPWGKVSAVGNGFMLGERYYWLTDEDDCVAMLPADVVEARAPTPPEPQEGNDG